MRGFRNPQPAQSGGSERAGREVAHNHHRATDLRCQPIASGGPETDCRGRFESAPVARLPCKRTLQPRRDPLYPVCASRGGLNRRHCCGPFDVRGHLRCLGRQTVRPQVPTGSGCIQTHTRKHERESSLVRLDKCKRAARADVLPRGNATARENWSRSARSTRVNEVTSFPERQVGFAIARSFPTVEIVTPVSKTRCSARRRVPSGRPASNPIPRGTPHAPISINCLAVGRDLLVGAEHREPNGAALLFKLQAIRIFRNTKGCSRHD